MTPATPEPGAELRDLLLELLRELRTRTAPPPRLDALKLACIGVTFSIAVGFVIFAVQQIVSIESEMRARDLRLLDRHTQLADRHTQLEARLGVYGPPIPPAAPPPDLSPEAPDP